MSTTAALQRRVSRSPEGRVGNGLAGGACEDEVVVGPRGPRGETPEVLRRAVPTQGLFRVRGEEHVALGAFRLRIREGDLAVVLVS